MKSWYPGTITAGVGSLITPWRPAARAIVRAHNRRIAISELRNLSNQTLQDIGLHRGELSTVVNGLLNANAPSSEREQERCLFDIRVTQGGCEQC